MTIDPKNVKEWLWCLLVLVLVFALAPVAYWAPKTTRAMKDSAIHFDGFVGEAGLAAKNSVTASQKTAEALTNLNETVTDADKLLWKLDDTIDASTETIRALGETATSASRRIDALAVTQAKAENAIDQVATLPGHLNPLADGLRDALLPVPSTLTGLNSAAAEMTAYIHGPLTFATMNAGELEDTTNTTLDQARKRWVAPYSGQHPTRHKFAVAGQDGLQLIGIGGTLWRDTK